MQLETLNDYEKRNNIVLPEILKVHFLLDNSSFFFQKYKSADFEDYLFPLSFLTFKDQNNEEIMIDSMISNLDLKESLENFEIMWGKELIEKFFPLSFSVFPRSQWLLIGISELNLGQIWLSSEGGGRDCVKLFDSLLLFYLNSTIKFREELLENGDNLNVLFKKWNENFWRKS